MNVERGILYLAAGEDHLYEARLSAQRAQTVMPDTPVAVITGQKVNDPAFDLVLDLPEPRYDGGDRVYHARRTPFEQTLYLDTDVYLEDSVAEIFDILANFDVAASINDCEYASERIDVDSINSLPPSFPEYNGGVIAFRWNERVDRFLRNWESMFERVSSHGHPYNQAALRYALFHGDVRIATLRSIYNCTYRRPGSLSGPVKVFHGRIADIDGYGADQPVDLQQARSELNRRTNVRAFYRDGSDVRLVEPSLTKRGVDSIRQRGIIGTLRSISTMVTG